MTMDDSLDPLDELVSAYLDGEATPAERARVEADAELQARVASFTRVGEALRDLDIDPVERESALAAALAAFDTADDTVTTVAAPVQLDTARAARDRRAERSRRTGRALGWLGAAAAIGVAVVAISGGLGSSDDTDSASTSGDESVAAEFGAASASELDASVAADSAPADTLSSIEESADGGGAAPATETTAAAETDDQAATMAATLPAFETTDDIEAYVRTAAAEGRLAVPSTPTTTPVGAVERYCTLPGGVAGVAVGPVLWQGVPGELIVSPDTAAPVRAVVLSADCKVILVTTQLDD